MSVIPFLSSKSATNFHSFLAMKIKTTLRISFALPSQSASPTPTNVYDPIHPYRSQMQPPPTATSIEAQIISLFRLLSKKNSLKQILLEYPINLFKLIQQSLISIVLFFFANLLSIYIDQFKIENR